MDAPNEKGIILRGCRKIIDRFGKLQLDAQAKRKLLDNWSLHYESRVVLHFTKRHEIKYLRP